MDITLYSFVVSFESGEQVFYTTETRDFIIREVYVSDMLLTDETYPGIAKTEENDYDTLLQLYTGLNTTASEYDNFKHFCEQILSHIENNDKITNFFIKDVDGNTYYNLTKDEIVRIYFEGMAQADENTNRLRFKLFIYTKRKDD